MASSNQVYSSAALPTPNVYVSQLVSAASGGGAKVAALTITQAPAAGIPGAGSYLSRNSTTGAVELAGTTGGFTQLYSVVDQSVAYLTETAVKFGGTAFSDATVSYDDSIATFTVNVAGVYVITHSIIWAAGNAGERIAWIQLLNFGATQVGFAGSNQAGLILLAPTTGAAALNFAAGDQFQIYAEQTNGPALAQTLVSTATSASRYCTISVMRLGAAAP